MGETKSKPMAEDHHRGSTPEVWKKRHEGGKIFLFSEVPLI
jgi:hypothetical protein